MKSKFLVSSVACLFMAAYFFKDSNPEMAIPFSILGFALIIDGVLNKPSKPTSTPTS